LQARRTTAALTTGFSGAAVGGVATGGGFALAAGAAAVFALDAAGGDADAEFDGGRVTVRGFAGWADFGASTGLAVRLVVADAAGAVTGAGLAGAVGAAAGGAAASTLGVGAGLAGAELAAAGAGSGKVALTAVLQPADKAATFF
jgi:hypothetical protein